VYRWRHYKQGSLSSFRIEGAASTEFEANGRSRKRKNVAHKSKGKSPNNVTNDAVIKKVKFIFKYKDYRFF